MFSSSRRNYQYDSDTYWNCNGAECRCHQPDSHDSMGVSSSEEHHIDNRVVEAQDQLEPLG